MTDLTGKLELLHQTPMWEWPEEAPDWISDGLQADDSGLRLAAALAAAQVADDELAALLVQVARADADEEVASTAAVALGPALEECSLEYDFGLADADDGLDDDAPLTRQAYQRVCDALKALYEDGNRPTLVRRRAVEASVRAPQPWHEQMVREAWGRDDGAWKATAVFCMGYLESFDETILEALRHADPGVRREAFVAAGSREIEAAGPLAMDAARDGGLTVEEREGAIVALETLDPPHSLELLERLARDADEELADAANQALEERHVFAGLEDLEGLDDLDDLDDLDPDDDLPN